MRRTLVGFLIVVFLLLAILPFAWPSATVSAQTSGYNITSVDRQVQVMYSGHIAILDTIHISGQITDNFMVGLPYKYSAYVLEGFAYDSTNVYQLNLGVQLSQSGFYGAEVDFNGNSPSIFTIAFVLSNGLITDQGQGNLSLDFPAYPSLPQVAGTCQVSLSFPSTPLSLTITKDDGITNDANYAKNNLPAFTYSVASAAFQVPTGTLQLSTISNLNRQITIDPNGKVTSTDSYRITGNSLTSASSYVISLPVEGANLIVKDQFGGVLPNSLAGSATGNMQLANVTLITFLGNGQTQTLVAKYDLPSARIQGSNYVLSDFKLFPDTSYYINQATITFDLPEGATIVSPQANQITTTSSLTRGTYQDTLTITENGISHVNYLTPQQNAIELSYNYSPVWVSFRPTFWAAFAAGVGCVAILFYQKRQSKEETYASRVEQISTQKTMSATTQNTKSSELKPSQHVTTDDVKAFLDAFEDRKQLNAEIKSMDAKAQKGKIPRRQYKVQRKAIENRIDTLTRIIDRTKQAFILSSSIYSDLARQLDLAEEDLVEADKNIRTFELRQSKGEISIETFKKNISDYQKQKDKAESAINGILLRLREKIR
jgi:hypothetical protein